MNIFMHIKIYSLEIVRIAYSYSALQCEEAYSKKSCIEEIAAL